MVRSLAESALRSFHEEWDRITCPTLLVLAQSGFIPAEEVTEMLRRRPETRAVSAPGTGHDVHLGAGGVVRRTVGIHGRAPLRREIA